MTNGRRYCGHCDLEIEAGTEHDARPCQPYAAEKVLEEANKRETDISNNLREWVKDLQTQRDDAEAAGE